MARKTLAKSGSPLDAWPDMAAVPRDLHALPVVTIAPPDTTAPAASPAAEARPDDHGGLRALLDGAQFDFAGLGRPDKASPHHTDPQDRVSDPIVLSFPTAFDNTHAAEALHALHDRLADRFFGEDISTTTIIDSDAAGARASGGGKGRTKTVTDPVVDSGTTTTGTTTTTTTSTAPVAVDYTSGQDTPNGFNIGLVFSGTGWTDALKQGFQQAAEFISDIIKGDVASVSTATGVIDDIRIAVSLTTIDGTGGLGGWGGYTAARAGSALPYDGYVKMDSADAAYLLSKGIWDDFALHEMLHALGFGTAWSTMGLVKDYGGDLRFTGANATQAYNTLYPLIAGPDPLSDYGVPVETDGGSGTAGVHWDDATFKTEIMTGTLNLTNTVSDMTIAALQDMGYQTIYVDHYALA